MKQNYKVRQSATKSTKCDMEDYTAHICSFATIQLHYTTFHFLQSTVHYTATLP